MTGRPTSVVAISWLAIVVSALAVTAFLLRISTFASYELDAISLVTWWFVLGAFPLSFATGVFMLRGKDWARQLFVATCASGVLFSAVILPFTAITFGQILFFIVATTLLYRGSVDPFFMIPASATPKDALTRVGVISCVLGVAGIALAAVAGRARVAHDIGTGVVLKWLTALGLAKQSTAEPSFTEAGIFAINDETALVFLTASAILLATTAQVVAVIAEYRREATLYLSVGYICGALALALFKPSLGFVAMIGGIAIAVVFRHGEREP